MKFQRNSDVVCQKNSEGVFLLNLSSGVYFGLNETGGAIWDQLESPSDLQEITQALGDLFSNTSAEINSDVQSLLNEMHSFHLITQIEA